MDEGLKIKCTEWTGQSQENQAICAHKANHVLLRQPSVIPPWISMDLLHNEKSNTLTKALPSWQTVKRTEKTETNKNSKRKHQKKKCTTWIKSRRLFFSSTMKHSDLPTLSLWIRILLILACKTSWIWCKPWWIVCMLNVLFLSFFFLSCVGIWEV
jgi:hypothetical protein